MNKKVKEPFFITRIVNFLIGIAVLVLIILVMMNVTGREIFEMLIFALAAVENFIGATISFSEHKRVRGNIYAIVCVAG